MIPGWASQFNAPAGRGGPIRAVPDEEDLPRGARRAVLGGITAVPPRGNDGTRLLGAPHVRQGKAPSPAGRREVRRPAEYAVHLALANDMSIDPEATMDALLVLAVRGHLDSRPLETQIELLMRAK